MSELTCDAVGDFTVGSGVRVSSGERMDDGEVAVLGHSERVAGSRSELGGVVVHVRHSDGDGRHIVEQLVRYVDGNDVVVAGLSVQASYESDSAALRVHGELFVRHAARHVEAQVARSTTYW